MSEFCKGWCKYDQGYKIRLTQNHRGYQIRIDTGQKYVDGEIEKQQNVIT